MTRLKIKFNGRQKMGLNICSRVKLLATKFNLAVLCMRKKTVLRPKLTCLVKSLTVGKLIQKSPYWIFLKKDLMREN
jgi:hypothetical protein